MLTHFRTYWDGCAAQGNPDEARKQLIEKIVERVFVHDRKVLALVLHGQFGVILGENETASTEIVDAVQNTLASEGISLDLAIRLRTCQHGSDGVRYRTGYCWTAFNVDYSFVVEYWLQHTLTMQSGTYKSHSPISPKHNPTSIKLPYENVA